MIISGKTKVLGLIGNPVEHTLSPIIHNTISELMNINAVYVPFHVSLDLNDAIKGAYAKEIKGLNVTVPYKEKVMDYLFEIDDVARDIGAVNTLVPVKGGFKGYNTDMEGLFRAIQSENISLDNKNIIIIGAGGAARAVLYMCLKNNANKIYILNRNISKAQELIDSYAKFINDNQVVKIIDIDKYNQIPEDKYIMFQCTSLGLNENDDMLINDDDFYKIASVGIDLIYNPCETKFMKAIISNGGRAINGLKMLLYQGVIANELWNGIKISESVIETIYSNLYKKLYKNNIILIGFMGSGKSTIGKELSSKMNKQFIDTDLFIEENQKKSIGEIFKENGEEIFRQIEMNTIKEIGEKYNNIILSTGGGLPVRYTNSIIIKNMGTVIYLRTSEQTILQRVSGDKKRPLLQCDNPYEKICSIMEIREAAYLNAADYVVDTDNKNIEQIILEIQNIIN